MDAARIRGLKKSGGLSIYTSFVRLEVCRDGRAPSNFSLPIRGHFNYLRCTPAEGRSQEKFSIHKNLSINSILPFPYPMTHVALADAQKLRLGIEPGGIRLWVGLEDWHDIIEDLKHALASAQTCAQSAA